MRSRFIICVTLIGAFVFTHSVSAQLTAPQLLATSIEKYGPEYKDVETAIVAFNKREFATAVKTLEGVRKKHPELAPAEVMMALLHLSVGRRGDAEAAIDRAVLSDPADPEAFLLAAELALRDGKRTFADLGYQRASELVVGYEANPQRQRHIKARIHAGLASLNESRGQFEVAAKHLNSWIQLDEKNPVPWGSLGRVNFRLEEYDAARAAFVKLNQMDKDSTPMEIAMGRLYSNEGMSVEALSQMEMAIKNHGKDNRARLTVAEWALTYGELDLAQTNIDSVLKTNADSVGANVLSARLARQTGNNEKAEEILTPVVLRAPNSFAVTNELARVLSVSADAKKRSAALQYAGRNFKNQQKQLNSGAGRESIFTYAWTLIQNGRSKQAAAVLGNLPSGSSISKENTYYSAKIYAEIGQRATAINALRAALSDDTSFPGRKDAEAFLKSLTDASE